VDVKDNTVPALHGDAIRSATFNADGSLYATVGDDKRVKLWDAKTWTCIKTMYVENLIASFLFKNRFDYFHLASGLAGDLCLSQLSVSFLWFCLIFNVSFTRSANVFGVSGCGEWDHNIERKCRMLGRMF